MPPLRGSDFRLTCETDATTDNFETELLHLPQVAWKKPSWRSIDAGIVDVESVATVAPLDPYGFLKRCFRRVSLFGTDMDELVDIIAEHQRARSPSDPCLESCCLLVVATCQFYEQFITTENEELVPSAAELQPIVSNLRRRLARALMLVERLCLSSKRSDWFAATMSITMAVSAAIIFIDAMIMVPSPVRERVWSDCTARRLWMRHASYGMLLDLLRVSTKGVNPIALPCFEDQTCVAEGTLHNDPVSKAATRRYEQTLLGAVDAETFSCAIRLKQWIRQHQNPMSEARQMLQQGSLTAKTVKPLGSLCLIYEW